MELQLKISDRFESKEIEKKWISIWETENCFQASDAKEVFSIVIPPPNITGNLHIGHALEHTLIDVITRIERKKGKSALWVPGMDHAGIAAQLVVERQLQKSGKKRSDYTREEFEALVWAWKKESGGQIVHQQRMLGESVDWSREKFTMDAGLSKAVVHVFQSLFQEGLIYRGERIINWCPNTKTAISDIEVEYKEVKGKLYHLRYPIKGSNEFVVVATTRPETMFGDVAVCANPDDIRYQKYRDAKLILPILNKEIPFLFDSFVDREFGSGLVKITPAHDANDFEAGQRLGLTPILIMNTDGTLNENTGAFQGMDRFVARTKVVEELERLGLVEKIEDYVHQVGHNQRGGAVIEPYLSTQWFVKIKPLAEKAIAAVKSGEIEFIPKNWEKTYFEWMENIRDWCISRQLWWGHRIPAYYAPNGSFVVASSKSEAVQLFAAKGEKFSENDLKQDEDVLDTWFSSGLWPFTVFGWPEKTADYQKYHPTSILVTGFDIIFFWVARMIMFGLKFNDGKPPFRKVLIHGLVRDKNGKKFSKTLGNTIDPLEMMEKYGTDAFRFFLAASMPEGKDMFFDESRLEGYKFFCNKIWNSTKFIFMNITTKQELEEPNSAELEPMDVWILDRFNKTLANYERAYVQFHFFEMASSIYEFLWNDFCDWYIELTKPRIYSKENLSSKRVALQTLSSVMRKALGLLNPFMPFLTEEIFEAFGEKTRMILETYPKSYTITNPSGVAEIELFQEVVTKIRVIRSEQGIKPDKKVNVVITTSDTNLPIILSREEKPFSALAKLESVVITTAYSKKDSDSFAPFSKGSIYVSLEGLIDIEKEKQRLEKEFQNLSAEKEKTEKKVTNPEFLSKAKPEVIEKEKSKLQELAFKLESIQNALGKLQSP